MDCRLYLGFLRERPTAFGRVFKLYEKNWYSFFYKNTFFYSKRYATFKFKKAIMAITQFILHAYKGTLSSVPARLPSFSIE